MEEKNAAPIFELESHFHASVKIRIWQTGLSNHIIVASCIKIVWKKNR